MSLLRAGYSFTPCAFQLIRYLSNKSAIITKVHKKLYLKNYQTLMVQPDGSTYTFRYHEPRKIITLPLDLSQLSEEEKAAIVKNRKPKPKIIIEEEIDDNFSSKQYLKLIKKK